MTMFEQKFVIRDEAGLHARPATQLVHKASQYISKLTIQYRDKLVDLQSILGVMSLGIPTGQEVIIRAEGPDAKEALLGIEEIFKQEGLGD